MNRVIFQSVYADQSLTSLKHALLYFGNLRIPKHGWFYDDTDDAKGLRYIVQPREEIYEQVEALADQGILEFVSLQNLFDETEQRGVDPMGIYYQIVEEMNRTPRSYSPQDLWPLGDYLQVDLKRSGASNALGTMAVFLAALTLQPVAAGLGLPCVDNVLLRDLVGAGMKSLLAPALKRHLFAPEEVRTLTAGILGQRTMAVYLPSFELRSFDEVLDLRDKLRGQIGPFQQRLLELSESIEALPWEPTFDAQVQAVIDGPLRREVSEIESAAKFVPTRVIKQMAAAGVAVSLSTILPSWFGQWVIGGSGVALWEAIKGEFERSRKVKTESAFSFLLQLRQ